MKRLGLLGVLLSATVALAGGDGPPQDVPRSPAAVAAIQRGDTAIRNADAAYRKAVDAALRGELDELKAAQSQAMKSGDLNEANRCAAKMDRLHDDLLGLNGRVIHVAANRNWQTVMHVRTDQHLHIVAKGRWAADHRFAAYWCGPDGIKDPQGPQLLFYLEGRIGPDGQRFKVGAEKDLIVDRDGDLQMEMFNGENPDVSPLHDGEIIVTISTVITPTTQPTTQDSSR